MLEEMRMTEKKFYQFCNGVVIKVIKAIASVLMLAMLCVVVFQVIWRGIFSLPSPWTEEVSTYLVTYNTFLGGIAVMIKGEHLAIDLVSEHVSIKAKEYFQILYLLVFIGVCTYLTIFGMQFCLNPLVSNQHSVATNIPRVWIYIVMPISMGLSDIYCGFHLFYTVRRLIRRYRGVDRGEVDSIE